MANFYDLFTNLSGDVVNGWHDFQCWYQFIYPTTIGIDDLHSSVISKDNDIIKHNCVLQS